MRKLCEIYAFDPGKCYSDNDRPTETNELSYEKKDLNVVRFVIFQSRMRSQTIG